MSKGGIEMIINRKMFSGPCTCDTVHSMATRLVLIEAGCMKEVSDRLEHAGLTGHRVAIYDTNTYHAAGLTRPVVDQEIVLPAEHLIADDGAVASVLQQLAGDAQVLIAVGAGTIHDIVRYCAARLSIPFVACPTAASGDGFAANTCRMHWHGAQVTMPGVAPALVLADLDVIRQAPPALARAGMGEALSKFTALADWKIGLLLQNETACPIVESTMRQAAVAAQGCCEDLKKGSEGSFAQLMYALSLSGIAMQLASGGYPASGAEHLLTALMDLLPDQFGGTQDTLYGERVGVMSVATADLYHRLAGIDDITPYLKAAQPLDEVRYADAFGDALGETLRKANTPDCLLAVDRVRLIERWEDIRRIIAEIPTGDALAAMLASVGAGHSIESLGLTAAMIPQMLELSPAIRNQLTLVRLLRMLKFRYASSADASRAPSRKSRYADKAITRAGSSSAVSASSM